MTGIVHHAQPKKLLFFNQFDYRPPSARMDTCESLYTRGSQKTISVSLFFSCHLCVRYRKPNSGCHSRFVRAVSPAPMDASSGVLCHAFCDVRMQGSHRLVKMGGWMDGRGMFFYLRLMHLVGWGWGILCQYHHVGPGDQTSGSQPLQQAPLSKVISPPCRIFLMSPTSCMLRRPRIFPVP